jgi:hypothetical protein
MRSASTSAFGRCCQGWAIFVLILSPAITGDARGDSSRRPSKGQATGSTVPGSSRPLVPVITRASSSTQPANAADVTPSVPLSALPPLEDSMQGPGLTYGGYDSQALIARDVSGSAGAVVADVPPPKNRSTRFDPLSPEGLAIGGVTLVLLVGAGWYFSRRRT